MNEATGLMLERRGLQARTRIHAAADASCAGEHAEGRPDKPERGMDHPLHCWICELVTSAGVVVASGLGVDADAALAAALAKLLEGG